MASSSSSSSRKLLYDVFPSFSGEDVRKTFLSHVLKELDRKLIIAFKDSEIERSRSLDPELKQAIKDSRIAVVVFSKNYGSSSWCLNELLEIVKCKEECGQMVIPVFYGLDPSHVRYQTGDFGKIFDKTCQNKAEDKIIRWRGALTDVANILGYHSVIWGNEANMIEEITNDVLDKLLLTPSKDSEKFVGIEDHIANMSVLLQLESQEVRMVGLWGSSGIGKTTIARALFNRLSRNFRGSIFIDRAFVSMSTVNYSRANPDDYNMKLHLQENFLSRILRKDDIHIDGLDAVGERLKNQKVLICIDDLDHQMVLDALVGKTQWFGNGSRIIVVTKDKHFLRAHGIHHIYEVSLPSKDRALEMLCQSAFRKKSPPEGFDNELVVEVVRHAGSLPLGLSVLGSSLRGRDKEGWMDMLWRLRNGLDGNIERALRVSYDGLNNKNDEAIFRHVACLFNHHRVDDIKLLLADSKLDVNIGLTNLIDKTLIHLRWNLVDMHTLLQDMGKEIVRSQSKDPREREFLTDWKEICNLLKNNTRTEKVLGISLNMHDMDETDELHVHKNAFKGMRNLLFLQIYMSTIQCNLHLHKSFDYLPPTLKYLYWSAYPMRCMPSKFCPENLVKLIMPNSNLEKLWKGIVSLTCLQEINLSGSRDLKKIPDLSKATNLEILRLEHCSSLLELPSSIRNLKKLRVLNMDYCTSLETIPSGIYFKYLDCLELNVCSELRSVPGILTNISEQHLTQSATEESPSNLRLEVLEITNLKSERLWEGVQQPFTSLMTILRLSDIPNLVELPSSFQDLNKLETLVIMDCKNLETLPSGINLQSLEHLCLVGCSKLRSFPDISRNISRLFLGRTAIEEIPWWIEKFSMLIELDMEGCSNLLRVSLNILKLKHLRIDFSDCVALTEASWDDCPNGVAMTTDNIHSMHPDKASSALPENYISMVELIFIGCLNFDPKVLLQQTVFGRVILSGEEVPSYFTHQTNETTLTSIPLPHISPSKPFLKFRVCAVCDVQSDTFWAVFEVQVCFRFIDISGNHFDHVDLPQRIFTKVLGGRLVIFDCYIPLNKDNTPLNDQVNYDHVDIQFRLIGEDSLLQLKGCGIQILENSQSLGNPNILQNIYGGNTSNKTYLGGHETEVTEHNLRWSRRHFALIGIVGIALLILVYNGIVKDFFRESLHSWG